ncbi:MAG TPA: Zn-ribbon domain-containing OB-fold protein [Anaerolineae bacterium]|nr:Zn-ribbon domain-containing OB-fold protein [Anaerolineae bacterium]
MSLAKNWRMQSQRYRLLGVRCDDCGAKLLPRRLVCPQCKSSNLRPHHFGGEGTVYSYTVMYDAPSGYDGLVPYPAALVQLDDGPLVAAQLTDVDIDEVYIGMPVEMVTRRLREYGESGMIVYGYKFRPRLKDHL